METVSGMCNDEQLQTICLKNTYVYSTVKHWVKVRYEIHLKLKQKHYTPQNCTYIEFFSFCFVITLTRHKSQNFLQAFFISMFLCGTSKHFIKTFLMKDFQAIIKLSKVPQTNSKIDIN